MPPLEFTPHAFLKNAHLQTILANRLPIAQADLLASAQEHILKFELEGELVRLQGFYSSQPTGQPALGTVFLIHGWLGCADSSYMRAVGNYLYRRGYHVFRFNMRDHGFTESLNEGSFHGGRLEEVYQAAKRVASWEPTLPFLLTGFSLGGNFVLRLAHRHRPAELPNLRHSLAINPTIYPKESTRALDESNLIYRIYFLKRWQAMLRRKQTAFPETYDLRAALRLNSSWDIGELIIPRYTPFPDSDSYYRFYAASPDKLRHITTPTTILTSADDPLIPLAHFEGLDELSPQLRLHVLRYGGHMGYFDVRPYRHWLPQAVDALHHAALNRSQQ